MLPKRIFKTEDINIAYVKLEKKVEPTTDIVSYQNKKQHSSVKHTTNVEGVYNKNCSTVKKNQQKRPSSSPGSSPRSFATTSSRRTRVRQQHRLSKNNRSGSKMSDEVLKVLLCIPRSFQFCFSYLWRRARAFFILPQTDRSHHTANNKSRVSNVSNFFKCFSYSQPSCSSASDSSSLQDDVKKNAARCKSSQQSAKFNKKNTTIQNIATVCSNKKICRTLKTESVQNNKKVKGMLFYK